MHVHIRYSIQLCRSVYSSARANAPCVQALQLRYCLNGIVTSKVNCSIFHYTPGPGVTIIGLKTFRARCGKVGVPSVGAKHCGDLVVAVAVTVHALTSRVHLCLGPSEWARRLVSVIRTIAVAVQ